MKILVTGSSGHLGEALIRALPSFGHQVVGLDIEASAFTTHVGSITDARFVEQCMRGMDAVVHTATLHKPHVGTHSRQEFIDTNISGTLNLLEAAVGADVGSFVFTSTTSTFGDALRPTPGDPAIWVNEGLPPRPKNIYSVTKLCAEGLCRLFSRNMSMPCLILRTSRFFPEDDDNKNKRDAFDDNNLKVNELLFRRADIEDMVSAHVLAIKKAPQLGFDRFIISATSPFHQEDAAELGINTPAVVERYCPQYRIEYEKRGWSMFSSIGRVYDNSHARQVLGWRPKFSFHRAVECLSNGTDYRSELARQVGAKGYHNQTFTDGPYPIEEIPDFEPGHDR